MSPRILARIGLFLGIWGLFLGMTLAADKTDPKKSPYVTVRQVQGELEKFEKSGQLTVKAYVGAAGGRNRMPRTEKMTFQVSPETVIRTHVLPPKPSDNPNKPARYTREELKKLKGPNPRLPGYEAKAEDLRGGLIVMIELGQTKEEIKEKSIDYKVKSIMILGEQMGK
ncbi:hypothetical protein [Tuwongella immobilis]|uniref:Uncharacterized protein n=1 Tax=Tuwongella immobilis TaxID=692036 RepID=A0A6C2YKA8_9BACT|nr:hypothetical protein [Tuwongella immobilis]VIP01804.1 unnamed protein product [Tuwongella immobilis]VTR99501.1 unnamed protein product [Tuwongella immobilis]